MRRAAVQRAVKAALTSHGFSYTLNAPYEKAAPRYRNRPHSHSFLTRPFLSSCSIGMFQVLPQGASHAAPGAALASWAAMGAADICCTACKGSREKPGSRQAALTGLLMLPVALMHQRPRDCKQKGGALAQRAGGSL